jgi:hypothetical protein
MLQANVDKSQRYGKAVINPASKKLGQGDSF